MQKVSVIVPARNEEHYIGKCLTSVRTAAAKVDLPVETVVVLNRCTDATEEIALHHNALTVVENTPNLARIRNTGIRHSGGDVIATIDADSCMSANMLVEVQRHLKLGSYIGGGVRIRPERMSLGILCSLMMAAPYVILARVSAGMFWVTRKVFEAVGGFDERWVSAEDFHFAVTLRRFGSARGLKYGTIRRAHIVTSCRQFDQFGDWYLFKNPLLVRKIFEGRCRRSANHFYYDTKR